MILKLKNNCIFFIITHLFFSSLFFSCISFQSDQEKSIDSPELEIIHNRPCWLKRKPETCEDITKNPDNWIFLVDTIITKNKTTRLTEEQQRALHTQLNAEYLANLESKIISEIKYHTVCMNDETKDQCKTLFQNKVELISKGNISSNEIEICETHWEKTGNSEEWKLFGLGKVDKRRFQDRLNFALKGNSSLPTETPKPVKSSEAYSISSPHEMTDLFTPPKKYLDDPEDITRCNDIKFKYTDLPRHTTLKDCISSIQNEVESMYRQRRDGIYLDDRVLETNSECKKGNQECRTKNDYVMVVDEMEREYNRIVNCWQNSIKSIYTGHIDKKKDAILQYKNAHHDVKRFNNLLSEWSYEMDVQIKNQEQYKLIEEMYQQKENLLNYYYLVFTVAISEHQPTNSTVIRKYSRRLAINEIFNQATKYNILKNILLENGELKYERILANYLIRITPDYFNQLTIIPYEYVAEIMKFQVGVSSKSTELLSDKDRSELLELKTKSFIISGSEDITLDSTLNPIDQAQLKNKTYQNWNKIAFNNKIDVEDKKKTIIQRLINDVIDANIKAKKTAIRYQNEYLEEKEKMDKKIQDNESKIKKINKDLFSMIHRRDVLPSTVEDQHHKESILSDVRQRYFNFLHEVASENERTIARLNSVQPRIMQLLVDSSLDYDDEFFLEQASEKIETVFEDNQENFCSGAFSGNIGILNNRPTHDISLRESINPVLVGYRLPVIKIKPEYGRKQARFSLPVMLKIRCESIQISFKYDKADNVIIDYSTNTRWKLEENRYPRKRKDDNDVWSFPELSSTADIDQYLNDYHEFCVNYSNFQRGITNKYLYQNYPKIKCIQRFRLDKNNLSWIIRDELRQEEWKIIKNMNYSDLLAEIRNTKWKMNTIESLENFFNELEANFKQNKENHDIVKMLSNKYFWTRSKYSTQAKLIIMLDFENDQIKEHISKKEETDRFGLVTRKITGF